MKVSLNWIKQYLDFELPPIDELVNRIGAQLGGVEEVTDLSQKYQGIVIATVVSCRKHEDSDHLNICLIDDGGVVKDVERNDDGLVQVVCGAPNVRGGLTVAWLPPGATVPESFDDEPFVLEKREIRGQVSNGMLASAKELALSDNHDGILEIDPTEWSPHQADIKPGADFAKIFGLDDYIIDIENKMFTHRPDCFGQLGVAREIAGILGQQFTSPAWYKNVPQFMPGEGLELTVTNETPEKVPRLMVMTLKDVVIKPSPLWLQIELARVGAKPINNVVDATNYIMLLTAQPTHAYDYDKIRGQQLIARMARSGEKVNLLNHKTYELNQDDIVIADGEGPIGLAGIMGGGDSEVSHDTKNLVLECASFDMYTVRRSSMRHGVFTDALTRFNKGQSPLQNPNVLHLLMQSIQDVAGGTIASQAFGQDELADRAWVHPPVPIAAEFINERLGQNLSNEQIKQLLEHVECTVAVGDTLTVTAPFWRTDIETREDVVEEVGRLYGFDKLPLLLPQRSIQPAEHDQLLVVKRQIREQLAKAGANELLTYSFVHGDLLTKTGQDTAEAFQISNALSPDLQYYRLSLTPNLLEKVHGNIKAGYDQFALFEIGKVHGQSEVDDEGLPKELQRVALVVTADAKQAGKSFAGAAYYEAQLYARELLAAFDTTPLRFETLTESKFADHVMFQQTIAPFDAERSALVFLGDKLAGIVGEYRASVRRSLKLPDFCAGFELFLSPFESAAKLPYSPLSRFPKVTQDITLKISAGVSFQQLYEAWNQAFQADQALADHSGFVKTMPIDIYQAADSTERQVTFRVTVTNNTRTQTDAEVSAFLDEQAAKLQQAVGAERI